MSDSKTAKNVEVVPTLRETVQALVNAYLKEKVGEKVTMDGEVVVALTDLAQEFLKSVVKSSKEISKHRGGKTLEVRDVALHLKNEWNIQIPVRSRDFETTSRSFFIQSIFVGLYGDSTNQSDVKKERCPETC